MKFKLLSIFALSGFMLVSCSDDDSYNTNADVTVSFGNLAATEYPEDQPTATTFYNIPVVVNGETNGEVVVTVEFSPVGQDGAVYDKDYIVTSNTVIIPAGETQGNIQWYPNGNDDINDDRVFEVKIGSVNGGVIADTNNSLTITLKDDDALIAPIYADIQGVWELQASSVFEGALTGSVSVEGVQPGENGYKKILYFNNFPEKKCVTVGTLKVNGATGQASVQFDVPQVVLHGDFNFSSGPVLNADVKWVFTNGSTGFYSTPGSFTCTANTEMTAISFDFGSYGGVGCLIYNENGNPVGWYDSYSGLSMLR